MSTPWIWVNECFAPWNWLSSEPNSAWRPLEGFETRPFLDIYLSWWGLEITMTTACKNQCGEKMIFGELHLLFTSSFFLYAMYIVIWIVQDVCFLPSLLFSVIVWIMWYICVHLISMSYTMRSVAYIVTDHLFSLYAFSYIDCQTTPYFD